MKYFILISFLLLAHINPALAAPDKRPNAEKLPLKEAYALYNKYRKMGGRSNFLAEPYAKRVYELLKNKPTSSKSRLAATFNYGSLLNLNRKEEIAEPILEESVTLYEAHYGPDHLELISPLIELGHAKIRFGKIHSDKGPYERALAIAEKNVGKDHVFYVKLSTEIIEYRLINQIRERKISTYIKRLKENRKVVEEKAGNDNFLVARINYRIGQLYELQKKNKAAKDHLALAVPIFDKTLPNDYLTRHVHASLVKLYELAGEKDKATEHCKAVGKIDSHNKDIKKGQDFLPLYVKTPVYPNAALSRNISGFANISFTVSKEGKPKDIKVLNVKGHDSFAAAATKAVKKFRYAVIHKNGKPIEHHDVIYKFTFNIER